MKFGETLQKARKAAGMSQAALARHLGVAPNFVWCIEHDERSLPKDHLAKLPDPIRGPIAQAMIKDHERQIEELKALL